MTPDIAALDVPPQEVKPFIYVRDFRFLHREAQTHRMEYHCHFVPERFSIGVFAVNQNREVVGLCRVPDYADLVPRCLSWRGFWPGAVSIIGDGQSFARKSRRSSGAR